jgi:glyoxylase-like metal-dependent hydrolase (beta-lactamase superfamily II)
MHRRKFLSQSLLSAGALSLLSKNSMASWLAAPPYQFKALRNNVGIFTEQGGTIAWLSNKEGIAVVDAEFPAQAANLIAELKKQSDKPFAYLINTHHHGDHTAGNIAFKGLAQKVVAHANSLVNQTNVAKAQNSMEKNLFPDTTFTTGWKAKLGDESIGAHYFGTGHTNGDSMIHFENANIVHTGDLVANRRYPYVDRTAGASVKNWIIALQKAQKQYDKDTLFVYGHAFDPAKITGNIDDLKAMQNYMERLVDFVTAQIKAGKTKDEVLTATAIPGVTDWQGDGIKRSLTAAYEELSI